MIELHRHLLGSLRLETLWELAIKYNLPETKLGQIMFSNLFQLTTKVSGLEIYIKPWELIRQIIRTPEDVYRVAYESAIDAHNEGITYIEFRNTPTNLFQIYSYGPQFKIPTFTYLDSINCGFKKANNETGIIAKIILSIQRQLAYSLSSNSKINLAKKYIAIFQKYFNELVVGIDLTGLESGNHTKEFNHIFKIFKNENIPITIHTGETESAKEVWDAINFLSPDRIGHGLTISSDNELLQEIKNRNIAIEICPTSNWILSDYKGLESHPLLQYLTEEDLDILICTDNPTLCNTNLPKEIEICSKALNMSNSLLLKQQEIKAKKHIFYKNL